MESAGRVAPEPRVLEGAPQVAMARHRRTARPVLLMGRRRVECGRSLPHVYWPDQSVPPGGPCMESPLGELPGGSGAGIEPPTPREHCVCPSPEAGPESSHARRGSPCPWRLLLHALQRGGSCGTVTIPGPCGAQPQVTTRARNTLTAVGRHQSSPRQETNPRD